MGWRDWIGPKDPGDQVRPSLRDVKFDASGMTMGAKTPDAIEWTNSAGDRLTARIDRASPDQPLTPWRLDDLRSAYRSAAAERGGGIVSVTFERANGIPIAKAISKFPDGMGYLYEGTIAVRFRDAQYNMTMGAGEGRSTGTREAMITGLLVQLGELQIPTVTPPATSAPLQGWIKDPYDETHDSAAVHTLSDDERLDEVLPTHPLSRVRRRLELIEETLSVASDLQSEILEPEGNASDAAQARHRMPPLALGILFMQGGKPDVAERHLADGIPMRDGEPILDTRRLGDTLILLGVIRETLGRQEDAAWAHGWAVRAFAATAGEDDPNTVRARANLARVYAGLGRQAEAERLLDAVIPVFERTENKSELALAVNALGLVRQSQDRHTDARACFERTLTLFEELYGPNDPECATVLKNLARSADASGDRVGSARARKRADGILWAQSMTRQ